MLLFFPQMHPELLTPAARAALPQSALFLDPGLAPAGSAEYMRPESAPFDTRIARALLSDTLRFGETVASPRDILPMALIEQTNALNPESSRAVLAEVEKSVTGAIAAENTATSPLENARRQAQLVLLLSWNLEERLLELRGTEIKIKTAWDRLGQSVSVGDGESDTDSDDEALNLGRELSGIDLPMANTMGLPWRKLLECYAVLVPEKFLATADEEIASTLTEAGIHEGPLEEMPGAACVFRAPAWQFVGLDRSVPAKPWLDAVLTLGVYPPVDVKG